MVYFYVIYRFDISDWRSIRPVEINHYDITMGNDVARDVHCNITMGNDVARMYIVKSQWVMMLLGMRNMTSQ